MENFGDIIVPTCTFSLKVDAMNNNEFFQLPFSVVRGISMVQS